MSFYSRAEVKRERIAILTHLRGIDAHISVLEESFSAAEAGSPKRLLLIQALHSSRGWKKKFLRELWTCENALRGSVIMYSNW